MRVPRKPKDGQVALLRNSMIGELAIEFVRLFDSQEEAEQHVRQELLSEPGDVYIIAPIVRVLWGEVSVRQRKVDIPAGVSANLLHRS